MYNEDDDDDDDCDKKKAKGNPPAQLAAANIHPADLPETEEEQVALALALSQSPDSDLRRTRMKRLKKKKKTKQQQPPVVLEKDVIGIEEEEEEANASDHDDNDDNDDAFVDPQAGQAGHVLERANAMSAHVLQTMQAWTTAHGNQNDNDHGASGAATAGLIVDGALALASSSSGTGTEGASTPCAATSKQARSWISAEEMQRICPRVTLAEYQLVGVNWMALLHGMKVGVADNHHDHDDDDAKKAKKQTNVNGVLADEMVRAGIELNWSTGANIPHAFVLTVTMPLNDCE